MLGVSGVLGSGPASVLGDEGAWRQPEARIATTNHASRTPAYRRDWLKLPSNDRWPETVAVSLPDSGLPRTSSSARSPARRRVSWAAREQPRQTAPLARGRRAVPLKNKSSAVAPTMRDSREFQGPRGAECGYQQHGNQ